MWGVFVSFFLMIFFKKQKQKTKIKINSDHGDDISFNKFFCNNKKTSFSQTHTHKSEKLLPDFIYDHLTVFSCNIDVVLITAARRFVFVFFCYWKIRFNSVLLFFFGEFCWVCVCVWHSNSYLLLLLFKIIIFFVFTIRI